MSDSTASADNLALGAALATLQGLLTSGETLEAWAAQRRLYALTHRRALHRRHQRTLHFAAGGACSAATIQPISAGRISRKRASAPGSLPPT